MRGLRAGISVAAAGLAVLAGSVPAQAGLPGAPVSLGKSHGLKYVRAKFTDVVSQAGPPAPCDPGRYLTGGGGSISGAGMNAGLNATYPSISLAGQAWQAEGQTSGASARTVTTYAICGKDEVTYPNPGSGFVVHQGNAYAPTTLCTGPDLPTGGGVRGQGGDMRISRTQPSVPPSSVGWSSVVQNRAAADTTVTDHVGCSDLYDLHYRDHDGKVKPHKTGKVIARCKGKEAVTGGGFDYLGYDAWGISTRPWDSKDDRGKTPDDGWSASLYNSLDEPVPVTTFAVCAR
jgi:hypothetical protein